MNWNETRRQLIELGVPEGRLPEEWQPYIDLSGLDLSGVTLTGADLREADLSMADLSGADLSRANLIGADLSGATLREADLRGATLREATINWQSHDLIAVILRRAAADDVQRRMLAGLILISRDWCWEKFLALEIDPDVRQWALTELRQWVKAGDGAPEALKTAPEQDAVSES